MGKRSFHPTHGHVKRLVLDLHEELDFNQLNVEICFKYAVLHKNGLFCVLTDSRITLKD